MKKLIYSFVCGVFIVFLFVKLFQWGKDYATMRLERLDNTKTESSV